MDHRLVVNHIFLLIWGDLSLSRSPEMWAEKTYGTSVDIWSFGTVIRELAEGGFAGDRLFGKKSDDEVCNGSIGAHSVLHGAAAI